MRGLSARKSAPARPVISVAPTLLTIRLMLRGVYTISERRTTTSQERLLGVLLSPDLSANRHVWIDGNEIRLAVD